MVAMGECGELWGPDSVAAPWPLESAVPLSSLAGPGRTRWTIVFWKCAAILRGRRGAGSYVVWPPATCVWPAIRARLRAPCSLARLGPRGQMRPSMAARRNGRGGRRWPGAEQGASAGAVNGRTGQNSRIVGHRWPDSRKSIYRIRFGL